MLILLALFFLFADIVLGSVDVLPDAVGFLLLFFFFLGALHEGRVRVVWLLLALLGLAASLAELLGSSLSVLSVIGWFIACVLIYVTIRKAFALVLEQSFNRPVAPSEEEQASSAALVKAGLLLILLCDLSAPFLSLFFSPSRFILLGLKSFAGLMVLIVFSKIIYKKQY